MINDQDSSLFEKLGFHLSCILEQRLSASERYHLYKAKQILEELQQSSSLAPVEADKRGTLKFYNLNRKRAG